MKTSLFKPGKIVVTLLIGLFAGSSLAQSGSLRNEFPELANLFNAFDVTQAELFDSIAEINANPATQEARNKLRMELDMAADMDMRDMMSMSHDDHGEMNMVMTGPYGELEVQARVQLYGLVRRQHSAAAAGEAFANSAALTVHSSRVLSYGRKFENAIWDIFANTSTTIYQKRMAVDEAIQSYLNEDPRHAVATSPKSADLYLSNPYAGSLKSAFPRLSGMMWANQWLQLASLEAVIIGQVDPQFAGSVPVTLERYWNKIGSDAGMTMFPPPSEMPSAPAISPQLYSQAPQAAIIIDNLNMLEAALTDVIAYPNLEDRDTVIDAVVEQYTADEMYIADTMDYLLNALRGGIFNQGGPAIGELGRSERNRSRAAMDMQHTMIMSSPN
ncbi:MAG: hypothetical protein O2971_06030 [Proteobacteria bacterium]|nr:hypothetical protein [Pseudomonadota bacterium]